MKGRRGSALGVVHVRQGEGAGGPDDGDAQHEDADVHPAVPGDGAPPGTHLGEGVAGGRERTGRPSAAGCR